MSDSKKWKRECRIKDGTIVGLCKQYVLLSCIWWTFYLIFQTVLANVYFFKKKKKIESFLCHMFYGLFQSEKDSLNDRQWCRLTFNFIWNSFDKTKVYQGKKKQNTEEKHFQLMVLLVLNWFSTNNEFRTEIVYWRENFVVFFRFRCKRMEVLYSFQMNFGLC